MSFASAAAIRGRIQAPSARTSGLVLVGVVHLLMVGALVKGFQRHVTEAPPPIQVKTVKDKVEPPKPVAPPPPAPVEPPKPVTPPPAPVSEKVTFAADTFFDFDKATLKADGIAKLDDLVSKIKGVNLEVIIAVGHTDSVGSDAYNQKLSIRRSEAVKAYLVSKGIEPNRVYTEGKGKKQPVADNKTAEGRAKNRRTEIEVVGTRTK